jgi:uncharacterized protein (DUF2147 family)
MRGNEMAFNLAADYRPIMARSRRLILFVVFASLALGAPSFGAVDASPLGLWARGDGKAKVRIEPCEKALCAINTWIRPGTEDEKVGDRLVLNITPSGPSTWAGEAWDPQRKTAFKIRIETGAKEMTTHGCFLLGLLCKDMNWTRIETASD